VDADLRERKMTFKVSRRVGEGKPKPAPRQPASSRR